MCRFCPECGRLAEYDPYFERVFCTSCDWSKREEPKDEHYDESENIAKSNRLLEKEKAAV